MSNLVQRLRGEYNIPVNDGGGLLDGKSTFTRKFSVPPIQLEAAVCIQQLEEMLLDRNVLLDRALGIIVNAIMHGMPITKEVADVRNKICQTVGTSTQPPTESESAQTPASSAEGKDE